MTTQLNESNFQEHISKPGVTVVDFFTTWCGPCRMLAPVLEKLERANICKVDGDQNRDLTANNNVNAYPTLIFFKDGVEAKRVVGVESQAKLQKIIDELA